MIFFLHLLNDEGNKTMSLSFWSFTLIDAYEYTSKAKTNY